MFQKEKWNEVNGERWRSLFFDIWNRAFECLLNVDELVFLGYGLPSADHHMFSFLCEAMRNSKARITVVDIQETNLTRLAKNVLGHRNNLRIFDQGIERYLESEVGII